MFKIIIILISLLQYSVYSEEFDLKKEALLTVMKNKKSYTYNNLKKKNMYLRVNQTNDCIFIIELLNKNLFVEESNKVDLCLKKNVSKS